MEWGSNGNNSANSVSAASPNSPKQSSEQDGMIDIYFKKYYFLETATNAKVCKKLPAFVFSEKLILRKEICTG